MADFETPKQRENSQVEKMRKMNGAEFCHCGTAWEAASDERCRGPVPRNNQLGQAKTTGELGEPSENTETTDKFELSVDRPQLCESQKHFFQK